MHLCSDVVLYLEKGKFINIVCLITCRHTWCGKFSSLLRKAWHHSHKSWFPRCLGLFRVWMLDSQLMLLKAHHMFQMLRRMCLSLIGPHSQDSCLLCNICQWGCWYIWDNVILRANLYPLHVAPTDIIQSLFSSKLMLKQCVPLEVRFSIINKAYLFWKDQKVPWIWQ